MIYEEKTIKSEKIYEGKILSLKVDTVEMPDKKYSKREIVEHVGGVGILAVTEDEKIVLVKQYRKAVGKTLLEIPAGKSEINEEPRETAIRELKEETGYDAEEFKYINEFYPTPGYCTEKIHIFLAEGLKKGEQDLDPFEFMDIYEIDLEEAHKMIFTGEIIDAKTIIAIQYLLVRKCKNEG